MSLAIGLLPMKLAAYIHNSVRMICDNHIIKVNFSSNTMMGPVIVSSTVVYDQM